MAVEDKLDIKLNQNIWGLVVSYAALGAAEHWSLPGLRCLSIFIAGVFSISVVVCLMFLPILTASIRAFGHVK